MRTALVRIVDAQEAGGATVAAFVDGRPVVDLWGGDLHERSLVHTWSAVKPVAGSCLLHLVGQGRIGLDDPVAEVWAELTAGADGHLRVRHLLSHAAGLVSLPPPGTGPSLLDWPATVAALAAAEPDWPPGQAVGEHILTYGHVVGEVVRRVDGRSLGRYLAEELAGPLGLDLHVGVATADLDRVAGTVGLTSGWWDDLRGPSGTLRHRAFGDAVDTDLVNSAAWRVGEVPAVNGHATARGLAGFYRTLLANGLPAGVDQVGAMGIDLVLGEPATWTLAGGRIEGPDVGMGGVGGQWAAAQFHIGLAWAFLTNTMGGWQRAQAMEDALLACVERA